MFQGFNKCGTILSKLGNIARHGGTGVVAHIFKSSTPEAEVGLCELEDSSVYRQAPTVRSTYRDPVIDICIIA